MPDFAIKDPNNLLVQQPDGKFAEMGDKAGVDSMKTSRGAALADFNLDGLVDLVVVNRWENAQIWRNVTKEAGASSNYNCGRTGRITTASAPGWK